MPPEVYGPLPVVPLSEKFSSLLGRVEVPPEVYEHMNQIDRGIEGGGHASLVTCTYTGPASGNHYTVTGFFT